MSGIRLVTRADDAGMGEVANRAIRDTVTHGIVRNVSLMAPTQEIRNAYELLGDLGDRVDFGLHVTLTSEWDTPRWKPLTRPDRASGMVRADGTMPFTVPELVALSPSLDAVMEEVEAQYELLTNLGFHLAYMDEHMGIGSIEGLAERLAAFAKEHALIANRGLLESGAIARLPGWNGPEEHPGTELADHLAGVPAGTYLIVGHPATKDEAMQRVRLPGQPQGEVSVDRNRQRRMFMDIEIVDYCENVEIDVVRYSQV